MWVRAREAFRKVVRDVFLGNPTALPHAQLSLIYQQERGRPTERLLDLAAEAIALARREDLSAISARMPSDQRWPDLWPGEHYKLLAGLVRALKAQQVIEVGTYQGLSALTLAKHIAPPGKITTFDVIPYDRIPGGVLKAEDLEDGRIVQEIADLSDFSVCERHRGVLESADLIFVDAAKDGQMEHAFLKNFARLKFTRNPIVVFDDIRVWNMLGIWPTIERPKLDLTSFGHYTGTGLIDWNG